MPNHRLKNSKQMERHFKGVANHYRIEILLLIAEYKNITLDEVIEHLQANPKTIGEHTRRLYRAGLINKKRNGVFMEISLSPYGKIFANFIKKFQSSNQHP